MNGKLTTIVLGLILTLGAALGITALVQGSDEDVDTTAVENFFQAINEGDAEMALAQIMPNSQYLTLDIPAFYDAGINVQVESIDAEETGRGRATAHVHFTENSDLVFSVSEKLSLQYDYADQTWKIDPRSFLPTIDLGPAESELIINGHTVDTDPAHGRSYQYILPGHYTIEYTSTNEWVDIVNGIHEVKLGIDDRFRSASEFSFSTAAYEEAKDLVSEHLDRCAESGFTIGPQCELLYAAPRDPGYENPRYEVVNPPHVTYEPKTSRDRRFLDGYLTLDGGDYRLSYEVDGTEKVLTFNGLFEEKNVYFTLDGDSIILTPEYLG